MIDQLPKGFELVLKVFSGETERHWVNIETKETKQARAFDWDSMKPITLGEERRFKNKEFFWSPTSSEVHYQLVFKKYGLQKIVEWINSKTNGVNINIEEFEKELLTEIKRGTKRLMVITTAWSLGRQGCKGNDWFFWTGDAFLLANVDLDEHSESWNKQLSAKGSKWRVSKK